MCAPLRNSDGQAHSQFGVRIRGDSHTKTSASRRRTPTLRGRAQGAEDSGRRTSRDLDNIDYSTPTASSAAVTIRGPTVTMGNVLSTDTDDALRKTVREALSGNLGR